MLPGFVAQEFTVPPMADKLKNKSGTEGYSVKYIKADMDDLGAMSDLELIMTGGVNGTGDIIILKEESFTFMTQRFICVQYLTKNPE